MKRVTREAWAVKTVSDFTQAAKTLLDFLQGSKTSLNHKRSHERTYISEGSRKNTCLLNYPFIAKCCSRFVRNIRLFNLLYNDFLLQKFKEHLFLKNYN